MLNYNIYDYRYAKSGDGVSIIYWKKNKFEIDILFDTINSKIAYYDGEAGESGRTDRRCCFIP